MNSQYQYNVSGVDANNVKRIIRICDTQDEAKQTEIQSRDEYTNIEIQTIKRWAPK